MWTVNGDAYDDDTKTDQEVAEQEQSFGQNVIVDLDARDAGASDGGGSTAVVQLIRMH